MSPVTVGPATSHAGLVEQAVGGEVATVQLRPTVLAGPPRSLVGGDTITSRDLIDVTITRWRTRPDARPEPAALSLTIAARAFAAAALPELGDTVAVLLAPTALAWAGLPSTSPSAWRFVGRVTDADTAPATPRHPATVSLVAVGARAALAVKVGTAPWPAQDDGARAAAILAAAIAADPSPDAYLATGPIDAGTVTVLARDVDAQPAAQLLDDLAADSGGELVELRDGTLAWHDAEHRRGAAVAATLTVEQILATPRWRKQLSGLVNDVTVGYGAASTQPTVEVSDPLAIDQVGLYAASRGTQLADDTTATARAVDLVGRWGRPQWRLEAVTTDLTRTVDPATAAQLLGLSFGDLVAITALPDPTGAPTDTQLWVEGVTESLTRDAWRIQLAVSDYRLSGPPLRWVDVHPTTTWATVPAALSWLGAVTWSG